VKRRDWIKMLERNGYMFERRGAKHDIYSNGRHREAVSRQRNIDDNLVKDIITRRGLR